MKFSIVTPLYNKEQYISDTIDSVLSQTYSDFEMIIVDDNSTDKSIDIVRSYKDSRIRLYTKPNGGVSAARNYGMSKCEGEIICFLDADDLWKPKYLEVLDVITDKYPDAGFFCCAFECFDGSLDNIIRISTLKTMELNNCKPLDFYVESYKNGGSIALTSAVAIRKNILNKLDRFFPVGIKMGEDMDMWFRVASITTTVYNNTPLMLYRYAAEGGLSNTIKANSGSYPYWQWYGQNKSRKARRFTTLIIYLLSKRYYRFGGYKQCIDCLNKSKGRTLLVKRLFLRFVCYKKMYF